MHRTILTFVVAAAFLAAFVVSLSVGTGTAHAIVNGTSAVNCAGANEPSDGAAGGEPAFPALSGLPSQSDVGFPGLPMPARGAENATNGVCAAP